MFIQRYSRNVSQCCKTEILTEKVLFLHQIQGPPNNFFFFLKNAILMSLNSVCYLHWANEKLRHMVW